MTAIGNSTSSSNAKLSPTVKLTCRLVIAFPTITKRQDVPQATGCQISEAVSGPYSYY